MIILLSIIVMAVGLLMYSLSAPEKNPKVMRIGEIMFFCGLLATLLTAPQIFMVVSSATHRIG